jgi:hypothetical protein
MGTDKGLYGIESRWDNTLNGVPGKIVTTADVNHSEISSDASQYIEVENGSDLYLTIDVNIQSIIEKYLEQGKNVLLLHGSSAAFWHWGWWRKLPGLRWVRPNDPDNVTPSVHPKGVCKLLKAKTRHPLIDQLMEIELVEDEIYTKLEQVSPITILMETVVDNKTEVQCCETITPWGGKIVSFIPGHKVENTTLVTPNIKVIINYLLQK